VLKFQHNDKLIHRIKGGQMLRSIAVAAVAALALRTGLFQSIHVHVPPVHVRVPRVVPSGMRVPDVRAIVAAARGAPPALCALAANSIRNGNWGRRADAPVTPLSLPNDDTADSRSTLTAADLQLLFAGIAALDPCERELSVRLLAFDESGAAALGLLQRLTSGDSLLRQVSAFGLGLLEVESSVDPLIRLLHDPSAGVRGNAAWALGRMEAGRALSPLMSVLGDPSPLVRLGAVTAVGHIDSASAAPALIRRLREDSYAPVRRTAAWALGQLEAQTAADALAGALATDKDASVREMSAWALGQMEAKSATRALLAAARSDDHAGTRETAVWALGQIDDRAIATSLGGLLAGERNAQVRATLAWALGQLEVKPAPQSLIDAVKDTATHVRVVAAWALSQIGDPAAIPAVRTALAKEKDGDAQKAEVRALIHSSEEPSRLADLLESTNPQVRLAVTRALSGRHGPDPWPWPMPRPRPFP